MPSRGNRHISSSRSRTKRFVDRVDFDLYCCLCRRHRLIVVRFVTRVSQQAKLWVQVIRQLRNGVKLKASGVGESARKPIEYELTPYEMMMDDIRSRRYKLRQVMVDGVIPPRVKKDAHAVILEFIRSRPPLRKVFITFSFSFSFLCLFLPRAPRHAFVIAIDPLSILFCFFRHRRGSWGHWPVAFPRRSSCSWNRSVSTTRKSCDLPDVSWWTGQVSHAERKCISLLNSRVLPWLREKRVGKKSKGAFKSRSPAGSVRPSVRPAIIMDTDQRIQL